MHQRGIYGLFCWNGLSHAQQRRLIEHGNLPIDYRPEGPCENGAVLEIETIYDEAPGVRFYCLPCGQAYLVEIADLVERATTSG